MKELSIDATVENIERVTAFVDAELEALGCPMKAQAQIDIAIDELFSNIARYAYNPEVGPASVRVEVAEAPLRVVITFIDKGVPYDPLQMKDPDLNAPLEEREAGGFGIYLVKKSMDEIAYEYKDGQNILRIKKKLSLDREQERSARSMNSGHPILWGVAGSGKTVVLMTRARILAEAIKEKKSKEKVLATCFNLTLAAFLLPG